MGTKATLAERDMRYRKLREAMAREGMSAVIAAGHAAHFRRGHIRYFTDTHMWAGDALLLIPLEGEPTLAWVSYAGSGWPEEMWVNDVRKAPYPETRVVDAMKAQKLTKGMSFWIAPPKRPGEVKAVFVDRIFLIRDK